MKFRAYRQRGRMNVIDLINNPYKCRHCNAVLLNENWSSSNRKNYIYMCTSCHKKYNNSYFNDNREAIRKNRKEYYDRTRESIKDVQNAKAREYAQKIRGDLIKAYGSICVCCGESRSEFLSLDHPKDDGAVHRKSGLKGYKFYRWLRDRGYPKDYRLLCMNCNFSLGIRGYCPHDVESIEGKREELGMFNIEEVL